MQLLQSCGSQESSGEQAGQAALAARALGTRAGTSAALLQGAVVAAATHGFTDRNW